jgi:uncharacterized protein
MSPCFADSSWFIALLGPEDQYHSAAVRLAGRLQRKVITSEYVVLEVINHLSEPRLRARAGAFIRSVSADPHCTVLAASSELLEKGLKLFLDRPDKSWSLTDCTSFIIMRERNIADALTADHHFEQAGFVALLRQSI